MGGGGSASREGQPRGGLPRGVYLGVCPICMQGGLLRGGLPGEPV